MLLSARPLAAVATVNVFEVVDVVQFNQGDATRVYFQLIDAALDRPEQGFSPAGRRYMPASGATLSVTLTSIDAGKAVTRAASMAFSADDRSIWYVQMQAADTIAGTVDIQLTLTEGATVTRGRLKAGVRISTGDC